MPRTIPSAVQDILELPILPIALCIKITTQDELTLGFTSHDQDLEVDGVVYHALGSLKASAYQAQLGTAVDNLELIGILDSDLITDTDLQSGRYDQAEVEMFLVAWEALGEGRIVLGKGLLGNVKILGNSYVVEYRSLTQRLQQRVGILTSNTCRVLQLGDAQCQANLTGFVFGGMTVDDVVSSFQIHLLGCEEETGMFDYGKITFDAGSNSGLSREIKTSVSEDGGQALYLQEPFPFTVEEGDEATLTAGCNRSYTQCLEKFSNEDNFRGEPFIPGNTRTQQRGTP